MRLSRFLPGIVRDVLPQLSVGRWLSPKDALARVVEVRLYVLNPCREFWFDIVDARRLSWLAAQQKDAAERYFRGIIEANPAEPSALEALAVLHLEKGDTLRARYFANKVMAIWSPSPQSPVNAACHTPQPTQRARPA